MNTQQRRQTRKIDKHKTTVNDNDNLCRNMCFRLHHAVLGATRPAHDHNLVAGL